jgi:hypothetical protein
MELKSLPWHARFLFGVASVLLASCIHDNSEQDALLAADHLRVARLSLASPGRDRALTTAGEALTAAGEALVMAGASQSIGDLFSEAGRALARIHDQWNDAAFRTAVQRGPVDDVLTARYHLALAGGALARQSRETSIRTEDPLVDVMEDPLANAARALATAGAGLRRSNRKAGDWLVTASGLLLPAGDGTVERDRRIVAARQHIMIGARILADAPALPSSFSVAATSIRTAADRLVRADPDLRAVGDSLSTAAHFLEQADHQSTIASAGTELTQVQRRTLAASHIAIANGILAELDSLHLEPTEDSSLSPLQTGSRTQRTTDRSKERSMAEGK